MLFVILNYLTTIWDNTYNFFFTKKVIILELEDTYYSSQGEESGIRHVNPYYKSVAFIYKYFLNREIDCQRADIYFLVTMTQFQSLLYCWKLRYIEGYYFKVYTDYTEKFLESVKSKMPYCLRYDIELVAQ